MLSNRVSEAVVEVEAEVGGVADARDAVVPGVREQGCAGGSRHLRAQAAEVRLKVAVPERGSFDPHEPAGTGVPGRGRRDDRLEPERPEEEIANAAEAPDEIDRHPLA